jgi:hypothetical protein
MEISVKLYASLPSLFFTNIWWARNKETFKDKFTQPEITTVNILSQATYFKNKPKEKILRNPILPSLDLEIP